MSITYTLYNRKYKEYFDLGKLVQLEDELKFHEESKLVDYIVYELSLVNSIELEITSDYIDEFDTESYTDLEESCFPTRRLTNDLSLVVNLPEIHVVEVTNKVDDLLSIIYKYVDSDTPLLLELTKQ